MDFNGEKVNGLAKALVGRVELLEELFKIKKSELTYSQIQRIAKSGYASEFFDLGDEIMTTYTATDGTEYDFPWRIVDFRDVYWENDDTPHPGIVLQSKYATVESIVYDAPEGETVSTEETEAQEGAYYFGKTGKNYTALNLNVGDTIPHGEYDSIVKNENNEPTNLKAGNNSYEQSAARQWLNSDAEKGNWWTSQHLGDNPSANVETNNGFMHGLPKDFVDSVSLTYIVTNSDQNLGVYNKFFLPSVASMNGKPTDKEDCYAYWKIISNNSEPTDGAAAWRNIYAIGSTDSKQSVWLRDNKKPGYNRFIYTDGSISPGFTVSAATCISPCCVIS